MIWCAASKHHRKRERERVFKKAAPNQDDIGRVVSPSFVVDFVRLI